jgi:acyl CoA:acetate/3-ketoacid CoA transferase alpha subunit
MGKTVATEQEAAADIVSGSTIAAGGFACGTPSVLLEAVLRSDAGHLEVFRRTPGCRTRVSCPGRLRRMVASYVGESKTKSSPASFSRGARGSFDALNYPEE